MNRDECWKVQLLLLSKASNFPKKGVINDKKLPLASESNHICLDKIY